MDKVEVIARAIARRRILRALGIMRPEREWGAELNGLFGRSVERTYPDHLFMADEIRKALADAGLAIVPCNLTQPMILAACDHIQKDRTGFTEAWAAAIAASE